MALKTGNTSSSISSTARSVSRSPRATICLFEYIWKKLKDNIVDTKLEDSKNQVQGITLTLCKHFHSAYIFQASEAE